MNEEQDDKPPGDVPPYTRRYAKGEGARFILEKAREAVREDDESLFVEALHKIELWEGMPQFEEAVAIFRGMRAAGGRGPRR